jgi:hypothetical protein
MPKKAKKKDDIKKVQEEVKQDTSNEIEVPENEELISSKKVLYVEIDDEVTTIYDKMKRIKAHHIYIVIPKRAMIFQSIVNLKILKRKAENIKKTIYFITNDSNGIYLAEQVGITVYNKTNTEGKPSLFSTELNDDKIRITPIKASVNAVEDEAPIRMTEKKISISQILKKGKNKNTLDVTKISKNKEPEKKKKKKKFVLVAPNRQALIALSVFSIFILLVIVYIALPGATIFVTPAANVLEKSVNITLADYQRNRVELETRQEHMIASYPISATIIEPIEHFATGKKFSDRGANASGKITIINNSNTVWPLVTQTRFQTDEGIVFRISTGVSVPKATISGPGTAEAFVTADPTDAYESIVGERGNIGPSKFFLPGLREGSRSKLYAESSTNMTGGITDFVSYISVQDIEAAKSRLHDQLVKKAYEELDVLVIAKSVETEMPENTYSLLQGEGAIKLGEVKIDVPADLEGQQRKSFNLNGEVFVSGVYYNRNSMLEILKSELMLKKSPQKELLRINEKSTSYRIFDWDEDRGKIKVTANIKGIEQFSIDPTKDNGQRLLNKIKEHIVGKNIEEAKVYIQNLPEINKVQIDSWPVWAPTIPKLPDNIDFEVRDSVTLN